MCKIPAVGICPVHRLRSFFLFLVHAALHAGMSNEGSYIIPYLLHGDHCREKQGAGSKEQRPRKAKAPRCKGRMVGGLWLPSPKAPLLPLPLIARPGHPSALSSPKHQRAALHDPAGLLSNPWRCRLGGPIPTRQPPDLPATSHRIFNWAEGNSAPCHSFPLSSYHIPSVKPDG